MEIILHFDPEHFREIYAPNYIELHRELKKEADNRFILVALITELLVFGIANSISFWLAFSVSCLFLFIYFLYEKKQVRKKYTKHKGQIQQEVDTWLHSLEKYKEFRISTSDTGFSVILDKEATFYLYHRDYRVDFQPSYVHIEGSPHGGVLIPKKSMSEKEFETLTALLRDKIGKD